MVTTNSKIHTCDIIPLDTTDTATIKPTKLITSTPGLDDASF